ncbi:MAG: Fur family transcriptional regulator [Syntrophomonadaceae bacterium]|nr:Fur family transcriptional regulator [Syntrophomonadaceae bacterium]MDD3888429.1 Fur family transcriptional regulator [Syntrophomonadaceae bacterium]MDD4549181.1 Fur family transcriptional regulator [Syntrophomonadaceae bacterium]
MYDKIITTKLKDNNYKLTEQRAAVLDVMLANQGQHLSAEEVLYLAKKELPNIGIATVYRTLERFAAINILYKTMFAGDKYRYEFCNDRNHQHHHIICLDCGKITEVEDVLLNNLEHYLENQGYQVVDHDLKFYAYCPECKKK